MNLYADIKDKHIKIIQRRNTLKESSEIKRKKLLDEASHVKSATEQLGTTGEVILTGKEMKDYISTLDGNWSDLLLKIDNDDDYYRLYEGKLSDFPQSAFGGYHIEKVDDTGSQYRAKDESNPTKLEELISKVRGNAWSNDDSWNVSWFIQEWPESAKDGDVVTEEDINNMLDDSVEDVYLYNRHHPEDPQEIPTEEQLAHDKEVLKDFIGLTKEEIEKFSKDYFFADYFIKKRERLGESCGKAKKKKLKEEEEFIEDGASYLYQVYAPADDMTIIFRYTKLSDTSVEEAVIGFYRGSPSKSGLYSFKDEPSIVYNDWDKEHVEDILTSDGMIKESEKPLRETNYARYLGVKSSLLEKVNQDNADINAKIREALRSKPAARKYEDEFKNAGITVDYSPREGVKLIGKNGRELSADRKNIYGPAKPGFNGTHDNTTRYGGVKSYKDDIKNYDRRIAEQRKALNLDRDDIIRKYPDKSTEEALAQYEKDKENTNERIKNDMYWKRSDERNIQDIRRKRALAHNSNVTGSDREIDMDYSKYDKDHNIYKVSDKVDYKGYLDSEYNDDNKDYNSGTYRKETPGQIRRHKLKNLKRSVNDTVGSWTARDMVNGMAVNDDYIKKQKQELRDEYKRKEKELEVDLKEKKKLANEDFKTYSKAYKDRVADLEKFRQDNNLKPRESKDFNTYVADKAKSRW